MTAASPIEPRFIDAGRRWLGPVRRIVAAHRPDDLESMRRFDDSRRALAKAVAS